MSLGELEIFTGVGVFQPEKGGQVRVFLSAEGGGGTGHSCGQAQSAQEPDRALLQKSFESARQHCLGAAQTGREVLVRYVDERQCDPDARLTKEEITQLATLFLRIDDLHEQIVQLGVKPGPDRPDSTLCAPIARELKNVITEIHCLWCEYQARLVMRTDPDAEDWEDDDLPGEVEVSTLDGEASLVFKSDTGLSQPETPAASCSFNWLSGPLARAGGMMSVLSSLSGPVSVADIVTAFGGRPTPEEDGTRITLDPLSFKELAAKIETGRKCVEYLKGFLVPSYIEVEELTQSLSSLLTSFEEGDPRQLASWNEFCLAVGGSPIQLERSRDGIRFLFLYGRNELDENFIDLPLVEKALKVGWQIDQKLLDSGSKVAQITLSLKLNEEKNELFATQAPQPTPAVLSAMVSDDVEQPINFVVHMGFESFNRFSEDLLRRIITILPQFAKSLRLEQIDIEFQDGGPVLRGEQAWPKEQIGETPDAAGVVELRVNGGEESFSTLTNLLGQHSLPENIVLDHLEIDWSLGMTPQPSDEFARISVKALGGWIAEVANACASERLVLSSLEFFDAKEFAGCCITKASGELVSILKISPDGQSRIIPPQQLPKQEFIRKVADVVNALNHERGSFKISELDRALRQSSIDLTDKLLSSLCGEFNRNPWASWSPLEIAKRVAAEWLVLDIKCKEKGGKFCLRTKGDKLNDVVRWLKKKSHNNGKDNDAAGSS